MDRVIIGHSHKTPPSGDKMKWPVGFKINYNPIKVRTEFTPWETEKFEAKWVNFLSMEEIPKTWKPYFTEFDLGEDIFVLVDKKDNGLVMSNSFLECRSNQEIIHSAEGDVMIIGLGVDLINSEVLKLPQVNSVLTVEFYDDVIKNTPTDTEVIKRDARSKFYLPNNRKFDVIYVDPYCSHKLSDFEHHLRPEGKLISWNLNYNY